MALKKIKDPWFEEDLEFYGETEPVSGGGFPSIVPPQEEETPLDRSYRRQETLEGNRPNPHDEEYKPGKLRLAIAAGLGAAEGYVNSGGRSYIKPDPGFGEKFLRPGFEDDLADWETDVSVAKTEVDNLSRQEEREYQDRELANAGRVADARVGAAEADKLRYEREAPPKNINIPRGGKVVVPGVDGGEDTIYNNPIPEPTPDPLGLEEGLMSDEEAIRNRAASGMKLRYPPKPVKPPTPAAVKSVDFIRLEQWRQDQLQDAEDAAKEILDEIDDRILESGLPQEDKVALEAKKTSVAQELEERKAATEESYQQQLQTLQFGPGSLMWSNPY
jgi:hypothetical protein